MCKLKPTLVLLPLVIFAYLVPCSAFAAELSFKVVPNLVKGDTAAIVELTIDPEGKSLNVVEGVVTIQDPGSSITSIIPETGGSVLTRWPEKPVYDTSTKSITFTGGARSSFNQNKTILRLRIFSSQSKIVALSFSNGAVYLADGKGTKDTLTARSLTLFIEKGTPNPINPSSADSVPPQIVKIEKGSDTGIFNGNEFITIETQDDNSGTDRVEVTEDGYVNVLEDDVYVLQNRDEDPSVLITAFDKAGNSTSLKYPQNDYFVYFLLGISILFGVLLIIYIRRIKR